MYDHVITKFSGMGRLPHSLSYVASRTGGAPLLLSSYSMRRTRWTPKSSDVVSSPREDSHIKVKGMREANVGVSQA